jgi:hypothetical protein
VTTQQLFFVPVATFSLLNHNLFCQPQESNMPGQHNGIPYSRIALPSIPCTDPRFVWVSSAAANVLATWARFGFTPKAPQ